MTELVSNAAIENAAIEYVIAYETAQGRTATDTRAEGAPADVKSCGRIIEVKAYGRSARGQDLWLEARQVAEAESNPDFWVCVVDNVRQGDPVKFGLRLLGGELLAKLVAKKRVQTTYILPFPVGEYDAAPSAQPSAASRSQQHVPVLFLGWHNLASIGHNSQRFSRQRRTSASGYLPRCSCFTTWAIGRAYWLKLVARTMILHAGAACGRTWGTSLS